jgi:hypothetical protein
LKTFDSDGVGVGGLVPGPRKFPTAGMLELSKINEPFSDNNFSNKCWTNVLNSRLVNRFKSCHSTMSYRALDSIKIAD